MHFIAKNAYSIFIADFWLVRISANIRSYAFLCVAPATHFLIRVNDMDIKYEMFAGAIADAINEMLYAMDDMGKLNVKKACGHKSH